MDTSSLFHTDMTSIGTIFLSATGIYLAVIMLTRLFGKRSFSKMSGFDFTMTIAVGSIVATTLLNSTTSFTEGLVGLASLFFLQFLIGWGRRISKIEVVIDNDPLLLMEQDRILTENMQKARVTEADLRAKLREANVTRLQQVKAVVFETTGDISVLHEDGELLPDSWILEDVRR